MVDLMKKRAASKGAAWLRLDKEVSALQRKIDAAETLHQGPDYAAGLDGHWTS